MLMFLLFLYENLFLQTYAVAQDRSGGSAMRSTSVSCHNLQERTSTLNSSNKMQCHYFLISISFLPPSLSFPSFLPLPSFLPFFSFLPSVRLSIHWLNVFTTFWKTKRSITLQWNMGEGEPQNYRVKPHSSCLYLWFLPQLYFYRKLRSKSHQTMQK